MLTHCGRNCKNRTTRSGSRKLRNCGALTLPSYIKNTYFPGNSLKIIQHFTEKGESASLLDHPWMRLINSNHHYGSFFCFFKKFTDALFFLVLMFANNLHAIVVVQVSFMLLAFDQQICMTKNNAPGLIKISSYRSGSLRYWKAKKKGILIRKIENRACECAS